MRASNVQDPLCEIDPDSTTLARIREGLPEGVAREIERRKREGIPYYISRNGVVEIVMPDGSIHPVERRPGTPLSEPPTIK